MQQNDFEQQVQQKAAELRVFPSDAVWQKVAAGLPAQNKNRRLLVFFIVFLALMILPVILYINNYTLNKSKTLVGVTAGKIAKENFTEINTDPATSIVNKKESIVNKGVLKIHKVPASMDNYKPAAKKSGRLENDDIRLIKDLPISEKQSGNVSFIPVKDSIAGKDFITAKNDHHINEKLNDTLEGANNLSANISEPAISDTIEIQVKTTLKPNESGKHKNKWTFGVEAAIGSSNVKEGLFKSSNVYNSFAAGVSSSSPTSVIGSINEPSKSLAFSTGVYAKKSLNKMSFLTGVHYSYYANHIYTGQRVDSVRSFNYNKSIQADGYYRPGNLIKYKNTFHYAEIPLLLQYPVFNKFPLSVEAGPTVGILLGSRSLVYNNSNAVYFTNKELYSKMVINFSLGAAADLAQETNFPFTVGIRFKYLLNSAVKSDYGNQHISSTLLYLKIPFKK